jgi:hypothetical protein
VRCAGVVNEYSASILCVFFTYHVTRLCETNR